MDGGECLESMTNSVTSRYIQIYINAETSRNEHAKGLCEEIFLPNIQDYYRSGWVGPGPEILFV